MLITRAKLLVSIACLFFFITACDGKDGNPASSPDPVDPLPKISVGDSYGGGIVAYLLQPGENIQAINSDGTAFITIFYDENEQHDIIAETYDVANRFTWSNVSDQHAGTSTDFGTGASNTIKIMQQPGHSLSAARACVPGKVNSPDGQTYDDWYLPSRDELMKFGIPLPQSEYWSSSESSKYSAWFCHFGGRLPSSSNSGRKDKPLVDKHKVRAIRAF